MSNVSLSASLEIHYEANYPYIIKTIGPIRFNLLAIRKNTIYTTCNDNDKLSLQIYSSEKSC